MNKETLSSYGWIVCVLLVVSIIIGLASPFANAFKGSFAGITNGIEDRLENVFNSSGSGTVDPIAYAMLDSSRLVSGNSDGYFRSEAGMSKFDEVRVDGNVVDPSYYTLKEGSTVIVLDKSFNGTLSKGSHTIEIISNDGSATAEFEAAEAISFTIGDTTYYATKGMTWGDWILSCGTSVSENSIVWTGVKSPYYIYLDDENLVKSNPGNTSIIYNSLNGTVDQSHGEMQTHSTVIQNGAQYRTAFQEDGAPI